MLSRETLISKAQYTTKKSTIPNTLVIKRVHIVEEINNTKLLSKNITIKGFNAFLEYFCKRFRAKDYKIVARVKPKSLYVRKKYLLITEDFWVFCDYINNTLSADSEFFVRLEDEAIMKQQLRLLARLM